MVVPVSMHNVVDPQRLEAVHRSRLIDTDPEIVFDELTSAAARLLRAPFAFMTVVDDERSYWKSTAGIADGTRWNAVEDSFCQYVIDLDDELIVGDATRNEITKDNPSIESMGVKAWAGCPIVLGDQVLGTFCVVDQHERQWTDDDRSVLRNLAVVASREIALRTERDEEAEQREAAVAQSEELHDLLDTLRASLSPPTPPVIPGLDLATWFAPARDGHLLLGDFYDAFPIDQRHWAVVVGDVCGHGAEAARLTAMIRYTLRAAMVHQADPALAVAEVDRALQRDRLHQGRFATLCVFRIGVTDDGATVRYARAGHPYPALAPASGPPRVLAGADGPPIGLLDPATTHWTAADCHLGPGDVVVSFTDGVTECADFDGVHLGDEGLLALLAGTETAHTSAGLVDVVRRHLSARTTDLADDTLVLGFGPR